MLVSYVLRPALRGHGLEEVALDRLGFKAIGAKEAGWDKGEPPMPGAESLLAYAGERVELARRLEAPMRAELEAAPGLAGVYREIEAPLVPVLVGMEETGVLLDVDFLAEHVRAHGRGARPGSRSRSTRSPASRSTSTRRSSSASCCSRSSATR